MATSKYIKLSYLKAGANPPAWVIAVEPFPTQTDADNRISNLESTGTGRNFNTLEVDYT